MKKRFVLLLAIMTAGIIAVNAQPGGGFRMRTVEERVQAVHHKIDSAFKLDAAKLTQVDTVFANFYRATDKVREEMMSGGERPDFQAMREKAQPLIDARDQELKPILGDDNFKKWKDEIEPAIRPQRPGGGRN